MNNKVKMLNVLNNVTLESTATATQAAAARVNVETYNSDQLNFTVVYTIGAGETSNTASVEVEGYDGTNWVKLGEYAVAGGNATFTPTIFQVAGAVAATAYSAHFSLGITFQKIRFGAYEAGVATNKGKITVTALIQ